MLKISASKKFVKSITRYSKSGAFNQVLLQKIINQIKDEKVLDIGRRDHQLHGSLQEYRECHIQGDLLLMYKIDTVTKTLLLYNFGTHSELF